MKIILGILIAASLLLSGLVIQSCYHYDVKVDSLIERAQVSADREDMQEQLVTLKKNMEDLGWTSGHFAVLWKTPENDLALHYKAVTRLIERLEGISHLSKSDVAYQTALDDIRGTIRELENPGRAMLKVKYWWVVILLLLAWMGYYLKFVGFRSKRNRRTI